MPAVMQRALKPIQPVQGARYKCTTSQDGKHIAVQWYCKERGDWSRILEAVRALPTRRYDPATKEWLLPNKPNYLAWLSASGWPVPGQAKPAESDYPARLSASGWPVPGQAKPAEPVKAGPDPVELQRRNIAEVVLEGTRDLIPGLRSYQIDFLKFAVLRSGRLAVGDDMGCIDGETLVQVNRHKAAKTMTLSRLFHEFHRPMGGRKVFTNAERPWFIRCLHSDGAIRLGEVADVVDSGVKDCLRLTLEDGRELVLTPDHRVKTEVGWVEARDSLGVGVMCNGEARCPVCGTAANLVSYPGSKFLGYCRPCMYSARNGKRYKDDGIHEQVHADGYIYLYGKPLRKYDGAHRTDGIPKHRYVMEQFLGRRLEPSEVVHHIDGNKLNNDISNLELLDQGEHARRHPNFRHFGFVVAHPVKVVKVEPVGPRHVYDVKVVNHGNFLANRVVVHNCGKTLEALAWLAYAHAFPALIVVNAPTKLQWAREYVRWLSKVKGLDTRVQVLQGRKPYLLDPCASAIINWDILADWRPALMKVGYKCLVGDEVQAIGNPRSQRAIAFRELAHSIPQVVAMSGTPARSKPAQFWTILNIMEPGVFPNYQAYLNRYCRPKHTGFGVTYNGATHVEELHSNLVRCMIRRTKAEVMKDLPPKMMEVVPLEVDTQEMMAYRMEERSAFDTQASGNELRERLAKLLRTAYTLKEKSLLQWVRQFLESGEKLLLFAWHRDVVDVLTQELKEYRPAKIYGGVSAAEREGARDRFINDPECRVLVANIQSGGVGIDGFQEVCSNVAFAEFSHTPNDHRQAEDRLHRSGQSRSVTSYYLVAPGTIDMDAVEVLDDRAKMLDGVLDGKAPADIDLISELLERRGIRVDTRGGM